MGRHRRSRLHDECLEPPPFQLLQHLEPHLAHFHTKEGEWGRRPITEQPPPQRAVLANSGRVAELDILSRTLAYSSIRQLIDDLDSPLGGDADDRAGLKGHGRRDMQHHVLGRQVELIGKLPTQTADARRLGFLRRGSARH